MILYLIRSTLCLVLMLVVYLFNLENEKIYRFNRFYILLSIVFSLLVPFLIIEGPTQITSSEVYSKALPSLIHQYNNWNSNVASHEIIEERFISVESIFIVVYCLVASVLLVRLIRNVYLILLKASKNKYISYEGAKLVLLKEPVVSHTFWNYVFINGDQFVNQNIPKEILAHELAHARQRHSLDVLFIELLQVFLWFNPILILYKRAIQLNHEFLADDAVVNSGDPKNYQILLLNNVSQDNRFSLSSNFNYMITKKRLMMLKLRSVNQKRVLLKKIAVAPLLVCAVFLFSSKSIARDETLKKLKAVVEDHVSSTIKDPVKTQITALSLEPPEKSNENALLSLNISSGTVGKLNTDTVQQSFYRRVPMDGKEGKAYDMIYLTGSELGGLQRSQLSGSLRKGGKAGFLIGGADIGYKLFTEDQLGEIEHLIKTLPLTGAMGSGGNSMKKIPGLDLSDYDRIFYFDVFSFSPNSAAVTAKEAERRRNTNSFRVEAKERAYIILKPKETIEATVVDYFKSRPEFPLSYLIEIPNKNIDGQPIAERSDRYIVSTMGGKETANLNTLLKPGDKITLKVMSKAMDDITPYAIVYPDFIKKADQIIYKFKD